MPIQPSDSEDEYFKRQDIEKMRKARREATRQMADQERTDLKELHWMRCPKCGMELSEVDFKGVKVDTCFSCGGMFLDKGEIDKVQAFEEPTTLDRLAGYLFGNEGD